MNISSDYQSATRLRMNIVDAACLLLVGLGLGSLGMYWYAAGHPNEIIKTQPHILIQPQDNTASKVIETKPHTVHEI